MSLISIEEIQKAISKIKSGKAPGADNIPLEALKADNKATTEVMHILLQQIWEQERIPDEWRSGIIVKFPKLLSLSSKILSGILLERLKTSVDKQMRDEQAGFRTGRSCTDQIACLRMIVEQSIEWQSTTYMNFIDFRKAFDMIERSTISAY